jgi:hypothetical protein
MKTIRLLLPLVMLAPAATYAADREFRDVVEAISDAFHTKPLRIPLMGLVNTVTYFARPAGTKHVDIAVFEDLDTRGRRESDVAHSIRGAVGGSWKPFLQVKTMNDGVEEHVLVYMRQQGKEWKLLITTVERRHATVIQLALNTAALERWLVDPIASVRKRMRDIDD